VNGSLPDGGGAAAYQVGASAGQPLMVLVESKSKRETLSIRGVKDRSHLLDPGRLSVWQGMLSVTQDYIVDVSGGPPGEPFRLTISAPAPIRFGAGGVSAQRTGSTVGGIPLDYVVEARAGQALLLNLVSAGSNDALLVRGLEDGRTYLSLGENRQHAWYSHLQSSQHYVVTVVPPEGGAGGYTLDLIVPAVNLPELPSSTAFPALGRAVISQNQPKRVCSTLDDGRTWRVAADFAVKGAFSDLSFRDQDQGWLTSSNGGGPVPRLFRTADGGAHWTEVDLPPFPGLEADAVDHVATAGFSFPAGGREATVQVNATLADQSQQSRVYRTQDGGATWTVDPPPPPQEPPSGPAG